jgi:hypothetical protein
VYYFFQEEKKHRKDKPETNKISYLMNKLEEWIAIRCRAKKEIRTSLHVFFYSFAFDYKSMVHMFQSEFINKDGRN